MGGAARVRRQRCSIHRDCCHLAGTSSLSRFGFTTISGGSFVPIGENQPRFNLEVINLRDLAKLNRGLSLQHPLLPESHLPKSQTLPSCEVCRGNLLTERMRGDIALFGDTNEPASDGPPDDNRVCI